MSDIILTVTGDKELVKKLLAFTKQSSLDLKNGLDESGFELTQFIGEVFVSRGRIIGKPWPRLNDDYADWKARRYPGRPPLIRTGEMMRSFKHKATARRLELWNTAKHFVYHQEGRGVPQRMMMRVDNKRAALITESLLKDITAQMDKAGLL